ncbi:MAG: MBL fold metallo-hydrolase [Cyclobacteriaceae bacterium]
MILKVLGCGDAFASGGRFNTSFLLKGSKNILVDCGASTLISMKKQGISPVDIDVIIVTHFHGDHYGGIPFQVISNKIEYNRSKPLIICGPKGVRERVYALQEAMYPGTMGLIEEIGISFQEYHADSWVDVGDLQIFAKEVIHSLPSSPHGIKVDIDGKMFAFSGDTEWTENLIALSDQSDLFICECNNLYEDSPGHLSYRTLLEKRSLFKTKRLMINHMGNDVLDVEEIEIERLKDGMEVSF